MTLQWLFWCFNDSNNPGWQGDVARSVYYLLAMALSRRSDTACTGLPEHAKNTKLLLGRARLFIESNFYLDNLGAGLVAEQLKVSVRTVQNLFAFAATTPSGYIILERRLIHAADLLRTRPESSITEIAFGLGFRDSAYFSRSFKMKYGVPPRQWRHNHRV